MITQSVQSEPSTWVDSLIGRFGEPPNFADVRRRAMQAYIEGPSPARVLHLWRYTDPALFVPSNASLETSAHAVPAASSELPPTLKVLFDRGEVSAAIHISGPGKARIHLSSELQTKGVRVLNLHEAYKQAPELISGHFTKLVGGSVGKEGVGKFEALNLALWSAGLVIHVPRNVQVSKPIHVWHSAPNAQRETFFATRLLVVAEERSEATIVDECEGGSDKLKLNAVVEVFAGQSSRVRYVSVQRLHKETVYHVTERASAAQDAQLLTAMASLGSSVTKSDFGSHLRGPGSNVELYGFLFAENRQHFDHHTVHAHESARSYSNLDFKVVLKDRSRSAYTGLIRIEPGCPDSEAYQENRNLLLNDGAKAESIPELEILTDEVRCTHGATMGTLDDQHIFYLMSRGLERAEAIRLIVGGFIEPTLSRLEADLQDRLRRIVEDRVKDL